MNGSAPCWDKRWRNRRPFSAYIFLFATETFHLPHFYAEASARNSVPSFFILHDGF
jgi:hypothetical protein